MHTNEICTFKNMYKYVQLIPTTSETYDTFAGSNPANQLRLVGYPHYLHLFTGF